MPRIATERSRCGGRLRRRGCVRAVSAGRIQIELTAEPACPGCPGGWFCPTAKARASQWLELDAPLGGPALAVGQVLELEWPERVARGLAWRLFGLPLLAMLAAATLAAGWVSGPWRDLAVLAGAVLGATAALGWQARQRDWPRAAGGLSIRVLDDEAARPQ